MYLSALKLLDSKISKRKEKYWLIANNMKVNIQALIEISIFNSIFTKKLNPPSKYEKQMTYYNI